MSGDLNTSLARNKYGIVTPQLAYDSHRNYTPEMMTYAGLTIAVGGQDNAIKAIGKVQSFNRDASTRTVTAKRELNKDTFGRPVDQSPGIVEGFSISIERIEIWENEFEIAMGYPFVFADLMDQRWSIDLFEYRYRGDKLYRCWKYPQCWITSLSDGQPAADGDGIYVASASLQYLPRVRIF